MHMGQHFSFRAGTHTVSAGLAALLALWMWPDFGAFPPLETWSMIFGYLGFVFIALTLLIGPLKVWLPPKWSTACLSIRRDVGIWAGAAGFLHVALVLFLFQGKPRLFFIANGAQQSDGWLSLFFLSSPGPDQWLVPNMSILGIANYIGLFSFFLLLSLWLTSSDKAEKWLGGSSWKRLHLANPLLFALTSIHGLIYIQSIKGAPHTPGDIFGLAALVGVMRVIAYWRTCSRRR